MLSVRKGRSLNPCVPYITSRAIVLRILDPTITCCVKFEYPLLAIDKRILNLPDAKECDKRQDGT